jgi:hypothetical protein
MVQKMAKAALWACLLALLPGCVEMTQTITLNPDGRGKVKLEIITAAYDSINFGPLDPMAPKKEKSLDELRQSAINNVVKDTAGIVAYKDVTVSWMRDGRLQIVATAYFEKLEDLNKKRDDKDPTKVEPTANFSTAFQLEKQKDGTLRLTGKNPGVKDGMMKIGDNQTDVDVTKLTDKEIDELLLKQRVSYQAAKPMMQMMFGDLKVTTIILLPGEPSEIKGFKRDGRTVTHTVEGNAILKMVNKFIIMDAGDFRKLATSKNPRDMIRMFGNPELFQDPDVTISQPRQQFDFDEEVKAARAAYPRLRKALGLDDGVQLPGEMK